MSSNAPVEINIATITVAGAAAWVSFEQPSFQPIGVTANNINSCGVKVLS